MHVRTSVFIAVSLDGFIARLNGGIDWLDRFHATLPELTPTQALDRDEDDFGYTSFIQNIDHIIMGRNTYETCSSFPTWRYDVPVTVLSTKEDLEIPPSLCAKGVSHRCGSPHSIINYLAESAGAKHVYVDGGKTIQDFLRAGLLDEFIISTIPVVLGTGIRLFGDFLLPEDIWLEHCATRVFRGGLVQTHYKVTKSSAAQDN